MEPLDQVSHITTYARRLDKQQTQLRKYGVPASNAEKMQQYIEQVYFCGIFTKIDLRQWENKANTKKIGRTPKPTSTPYPPRSIGIKKTQGQQRAGLRVHIALVNSRAPESHLTDKVSGTAQLAQYPA